MTQVWGVSHMGYLYLLLTALPLSLLLTLSPPLPLTLFLLWLLVSYGVVMCGFFGFLGISERVLGKRREDGGIPWWSVVVFLPWFLAVNVVWYLSNVYYNVVKNENISDEVFEGLHVGRLPRTSNDIPPHITLIVDLTAEFSAHHTISPSSPSSSPSSSSSSSSPSWSYLCCPSFDTLAPTHIEIVTDTLSRMVKEQGPIYVHCAFGHGRSATFAAAWLILKGHARDAEEAEAIMKRKRPTVGLNMTQKSFLSLYLEAMEKRRDYDVLLETEEEEEKEEHHLSHEDFSFENNVDYIDVEDNNNDNNNDENQNDNNENNYHDDAISC